jgi:hypothetical protein
LKVLRLDQNQAIVADDSILADFMLKESSLEKIGIGNTYFHTIRRFDLLINKEFLKFIDIGVLDYTSLSSFLKYIEHTNLEKVKITLNKPSDIDSLKFLLKNISSHVFNMRYLKSITFHNTYTDETFSTFRPQIEAYLIKYFLLKIKHNRTIRQINLKHRTNNISAYILSGFGFIKEKYHESSLTVIFALERALPEIADNRKIIKNVIKQLYVKYRKISI